MALNKEQFLAVAARPKTKALDIDGIGEVIISELSALEAERLAVKNFPVGPDEKVTVSREGHLARWAIATVRNPDGTPMFSDADFEAVAAIPAATLRKIVDEAKRLNGTTAGADEDAAKN